MPELAKSSIRSRLVLKHPANRVGLMPHTIYDLKGAPLGWDEMKPLALIPSKISSYLDKALISEIRRYKINDEFTRNQYFVKLCDGSFVEVLY